MTVLQAQCDRYAETGSEWKPDDHETQSAQELENLISMGMALYVKIKRQANDAYMTVQDAEVFCGATRMWFQVSLPILDAISEKEQSGYILSRGDEFRDVFVEAASQYRDIDRLRCAVDRLLARGAFSG